VRSRDTKDVKELNIEKFYKIGKGLNAIDRLKTGEPLIESWAKLLTVTLLNFYRAACVADGILELSAGSCLFFGVPASNCSIRVVVL